MMQQLQLDLFFDPKKGDYSRHILTLSPRPLMCICTFPLPLSPLADSCPKRLTVRDGIKLSCTYVNKVLAHSPNLPANSAALWRGCEEGRESREEVRSDRRRMTSAVWRTGTLGRAVSV